VLYFLFCQLLDGDWLLLPINCLLTIFPLPLERCVADDLEGEGEIIKTFTVDATVDGGSKEGAVTGKVNYNLTICIFCVGVCTAGIY